MYRNDILNLTDSARSIGNRMLDLNFLVNSIHHIVKRDSQRDVDVLTFDGLLERIETFVAIAKAKSFKATERIA